MDAQTLLFFQKKQEVLPLYAQVEDFFLTHFPDTRVVVAKTQISFFTTVMYACISLPRGKMTAFPQAQLLLTLCLDAPLDSPRVYQRVEAAPRRWTHHFPLRQPEDLDEEMREWIQRAHAFAAFRGRKS